MHMQKRVLHEACAPVPGAISVPRSRRHADICAKAVITCAIRHCVCVSVWHTHLQHAKAACSRCPSHRISTSSWASSCPIPSRRLSGLHPSRRLSSSSSRHLSSSFRPLSLPSRSFSAGSACAPPPSPLSRPPSLLGPVGLLPQPSSLPPPWRLRRLWPRLPSRRLPLLRLLRRAPPPLPLPQQPA